jgi:acetoin utilization deacetylase AcuC-like enzyme
MNPAAIALTLVPSPEHTLTGHPENAGRFQHFDKLDQVPFSDRFVFIEPVIASQQAVSAIHPIAYLEALEQAAERGPGFVDYGDTYVTPHSYQAALEAAGGGMEIVSAVVQGQAGSGFALVRPPGHHATFTRAMGFCLLNNIAIAARHAQSLGLQRIMIVDFDVHHGNGTQDIFERDGSVLYISTHQSGIYPGTGKLKDVGLDEGIGTVVNMPLQPRAGDEAFKAIFEQIIVPIGERFTPQILMVSAGFDAHWTDPLASLQLTTSGYHYLGKVLKEFAESLCQGRIICFLEGGYDPEALSDNVLAIIHALAGEKLPQDRLGSAPFPEPDVSNLLQNVRSIHSL